jgi:DNA-binding NarL/FixJ family response regulator
VGSQTIRLLVVDDHEVARAGLQSLLRRDDRIHIVGLASTGAESLDLFDKTSPDVVVLDHRLPDMTGANVCAEMVRRRPSASIIILTSFESDEVIHACLVAGARGYLTKAVANGEIAAAVHAVADGGVYLAPEITERVVTWARQAKQIQGDRALAAEEIEILGLVAQGMSNRQIAGELCLSESSVKVRLQTAMRKLGATRRLDAVALGLRRGVI